jgi:hypothetical protein
VLRHQVRILQRQLHGRVRYRPVDRAMLAALSRLLPRARWPSSLVAPDTLVRRPPRSPGASGDAGENGEARGDPRCPMSSSS